MKEKLKPLINTGKDFASGMGQRKLTIYATSGCYYLFMSLVPIVMIVCCILPYTPFSQTLILSYIDIYFAPSLGEIVRKIVDAVYASNAGTLTISILLTLYSASASMKALMHGINAAYDCRKKENIVIFTLRALLYMVLLVVTLVLSLVIMVYGGKILLLLRRYFVSVGPLNALLSKGRYFLVMIILAVVFTLLFTLMPSEPVKVKDQIPGAIFTAILWVVFSSVFTLYIGISNKYGAYGFIGTIMVAMMWMYYCLFFMLIGGYMNSWLSTRKAPVPSLPDSSQTVLIPGSPDSEISQEGIVSSDRLTSEEDPLSQDFLSEDAPLPDPEAEDELLPEEKKKLPKGMIIGIAAAAFLAIAGTVILFLKKRKTAAARKK